MSRPAAHRVAGQKRGINPTYLNKDVAVRKKTQTQAQSGPRSARGGSGWRVNTRAHIRPYDAWIGVLSEQEGFETVPYESVVVVRRWQADSNGTDRDMGDLKPNDEVKFDGRSHRISYVETDLYVDGVVLYVSGQGTG